MDASFGKLLSAVYELEGLLLVLEKHEDDTPSLVIDAIKEKAALIAKEAQELTSHENKKETSHEDKCENESPFDDETPIENEDENLSADNEISPVIEDNKVKSTISFDDEEEETETPPEIPSPQEVPQEEPQEEPVKEPEIIVSTATLLQEVADDEPEFSTEVQEEAEEVPEIKMDDDEDIEDDEIEEDDDDEEDDELANNGPSNDIRKAFSQNDSIRFRRELFGNIAADYKDALNEINAMQDFDEATEYFYDYLGFDPQNEEVIAFMAIVKQHFL